MTAPHPHKDEVMNDSATLDEAVDLLECAGWKGYAQAIRELRETVTAQQSTISNLIEELREARALYEANHG